MIVDYKYILKIDLDLKTKKEAIKVLRYRLIFLQDLKILFLKNIIRIELLKKKNYSARIYINEKPKNELYIIIIQAILGDDDKRVGVNFRDYLLGIKNYNRSFNAKLYADGSIIYAQIENVTKEVFSKIKIKNGN